ncbi:hypothetical protein FN846DRAFT_887082 [Sphaerosporella brunnea]|uniref:Uncharacterized protein n=1 Tax=Sphaerosporella brunnea TaxID=1250544 RepID=A0A5J5F7T4_9PEZI|nr:hypothetical protein FN846DRAFT_887082 [Sphaerosporella brunnea]
MPVMPVYWIIMTNEMKAGWSFFWNCTSRTSLACSRSPSLAIFDPSRRKRYLWEHHDADSRCSLSQRTPSGHKSEQPSHALDISSPGGPTSQEIKTYEAHTDPMSTERAPTRSPEDSPRHGPRHRLANATLRPRVPDFTLAHPPPNPQSRTEATVTSESAGRVHERQVKEWFGTGICSRPVKLGISKGGSGGGAVGQTTEKIV